MIERPKILIVDDKPENLFVLSRTLEAVDAELISANNGNDALRETLNHHFALAILDIQMPEMDGYELAEFIRNEEQTSKLPIILLSAVFSDEFHEFKGYRSGAVDFIRKPYNPDILIQKVKTFLELDIKQRELEDLNKNLELRVEEEVEKRRIHEQLMIQQSKMAEMGEMISVIAHQWRQPLNTVGLLIQDVDDAFTHNELDKEYLADFVKNSLGQLHVMSQTIDDFRDFYKPSKEKVDFSISTLLDDVLHVVSAQLKHNQITVVRKQKEELFANGYPNEFKQVVMNLLNNAKDAIHTKKEQLEKGSFKGEIVIEVSSQNNVCLICLCDNGGGVPEEKLEEIFHPHYTSKSKEKGTGIGLYLAKIIIEKNMQGELIAKNKGDGASFVIKLQSVPKQD